MWSGGNLVEAICFLNKIYAAARLTRLDLKPIKPTLGHKQIAILLFPCAASQLYETYNFPGLSGSHSSAHTFSIAEKEQPATSVLSFSPILPIRAIQTLNVWAGVVLV